MSPRLPSRRRAARSLLLPAALVPYAVAWPAHAAVPAAQRTHPIVLPSRGDPHTKFSVRLTLAVAPGHSGVLQTDYRIQLTPPLHARIPRCSPASPALIESGEVHQRVTVPLLGPGRGWCRGRYTVNVFLERGPSCQKASAGAAPYACPEFATQELPAGRATFTVVR